MNNRIPEFSALAGRLEPPATRGRTGALSVCAMFPHDPDRALTHTEEECHFTGRVMAYDTRPNEDRRSVALEFDDEYGKSFVIYVEQHKGSTYLCTGPTSGAPLGDWMNLWAEPRVQDGDA